MDLRRQARIIGASLWRPIASLLLVIDAERTRRASARPGRVALAKAGARVVGATLKQISALAGTDYAYQDHYRAYGAAANAKPAPHGASVPGPLPDTRG
jgi:hypothetical protein